MNLQKPTYKDFQSNQEVRWCPGCGDYSILAAVQRLLPELNIKRENHVFVSGIGCASRFPYYMNTYGFHSIHGRAPAIATGVKLTNPELCVWIVSGDGDSMSIGTNHLIHLARRNVNVNYLLFNNRVYGLTKGQYSPTSQIGQKSKTTPEGSFDMPLDPASLVLAAGATFVARAVATDHKNLSNIIKTAVEHQGCSFIEIYQNCNVFNDGAFADFSDKSKTESQQLHVKHNQPLIFDSGEKGIDFSNLNYSVSHDLKKALVYDQTNRNMAKMLAAMPRPDFPVALGVLYQEKRETYEQEVKSHSRYEINASKTKQQLQELLKGSDSWEVK